MNTYVVSKLVKFIKHNSESQLAFGGHGYSDTRNALKVGKHYKVRAQVHDWHTRYYIDDKYYNSVCFDDVTVEDIAHLQSMNGALSASLELALNQQKIDLAEIEQLQAELAQQKENMAAMFDESQAEIANKIGELDGARRACRVAVIEAGRRQDRIELLEGALRKIASIESDKRKRGIGYDSEIYQIAVLFLPEDDDAIQAD